MSISKKSIIGGLGLALSLASGLAQAGQECIKAGSYKPLLVTCNFNMTKVPGTSAIEFSVIAWQADIRTPIDITPVVQSILRRDGVPVKVWSDNLPGGPDKFWLETKHSYKSGLLRQSHNYNLEVRMNSSVRAANTLKVTTNR